MTLLDSRNLVLEVESVDDVVTEYGYDGLGRRTKTTVNPDGTESNVEREAILTVYYDKVGRVSARTDDAGNWTTYSYDAKGHLTSITHDDDDAIEFTYNGLGKVKTKTYVNDSTELLTVEYDYDLRGLLVTKDITWDTTPTWTDYSSFKTEEETFQYDGLYRLTKATDDDTEVTFTYTSLGQLSGEALRIKAGGTWNGQRVTVSSWDDTGKERESVTYPISGRTFEMAYDTLHRVTKVELSGSPSVPMVKYWYLGAGRRPVKRTRGIDLGDAGEATYTTEWTYDALMRPTEITHDRDGTTLRDFDYTWGTGSTGRLFQRSSYDISDASGAIVEHDYSYDPLGRLTKDVRTTSGSDEYTYGLTDTQFLNWRKLNATTTEVSYTAATDGSLQVASWDDGTSRTAVHDIRGSITDAGDGRDFYYDHENRLVHIDTDGGTDWWFRYDALGRRVAEKEGTGDERLFYYDGARIIEETDESDNLERLSLFGNGIDEVLYSGNWSGSALTDHRWPVEDHLGSVVVVVDDSGTVKTDYDYTTAYGETTNDGTEDYPYAFTGRRLLGDTGLYDYRTRTYMPILGRFLQRDSIGVWGDPANFGNGYAYVAGDPVNRGDAWGRSGSSPSFSPGGAFGGVQQAAASIECVGRALRLATRDLHELEDEGYEPGRNDMKLKHCLNMCHGQRECGGSLGVLVAPVVAVVGVGYEVGTAIAGPLDGQHPLDWAWDTPGDLVANTLGQICATLLFVSCKDCCKGAQAIPGPDHHMWRDMHRRGEEPPPLSTSPHPPAGPDGFGSPEEPGLIEEIGNGIAGAFEDAVGAVGGFFEDVGGFLGL